MCQDSYNSLYATLYIVFVEWELDTKPVGAEAAGRMIDFQFVYTNGDAAVGQFSGCQFSGCQFQNLMMVT